MMLLVNRQPDNSELSVSSQQPFDVKVDVALINHGFIMVLSLYKRSNHGILPIDPEPQLLLLPTRITSFASDVVCSHG